VKQHTSASKGKDGYALVTLYCLNDARSRLVNDRILETTQSAVIAYLRYGTDFPPPSDQQECGS
ncbi:hypothetical protein, partial [Pseudomonas savastanoi]|uniref:hypothetical protein n=1 Tax=Pseudomonas savastanoi TaxID=29438 RepID=UPI001C81E724